MPVVPRKPPGTLLIRAHAGPGVGAGHVMRCLALGQAWRDRGGSVHFRLGREGASLEARLRVEGMETSFTEATAAGDQDARETAALAHRLGASAAALDGYPFTGRFQSAVRATVGPVGRTLSIDDNGECSPYTSDLILNQNPHAEEGWYRERPSGSALLLGLRYALLRKEFLAKGPVVPATAPPGVSAAATAAPADPASQRAPASRRSVRNLLITLGGADPDNVTLKVILALRRMGLADQNDLRAKVLVGALNPNLASLEAAVREKSPVGIELVRDARDMPGLMAWADLAVSAAGSTVWEMLYMGLPALVIATADNQRGIAAALHSMGAALSLGWHAELNPETIAGALAKRIAEHKEGGAASGSVLVDGLGASRVAAVLAGEGAA